MCNQFSRWRKQQSCALDSAVERVKQAKFMSWNAVAWQQHSQTVPVGRRWTSSYLPRSQVTDAIGHIELASGGSEPASGGSSPAIGGSQSVSTPIKRPSLASQDGSASSKKLCAHEKANEPSTKPCSTQLSSTQINLKCHFRAIRQARLDTLHFVAWSTRLLKGDCG